jgi:hypothetical protein
MFFGETFVIGFGLRFGFKEMLEGRASKEFSKFSPH